MIAVLGAGPHGRQIAALPEFRASRLYDDNLAGYPPIAEARAMFVVGAAWPHVRRAIVETGIWHEIEPGVQYQPLPYRQGNVIFPGAQLGHDIKIGRHVHVGYNAVITHGCTLGDYVSVCPGAVISGETTIDDDVFVGANATVIHGGIIIGRGAIIGAGAVVTDNVPAGSTVVGNPARIIQKRNCICTDHYAGDLLPNPACPRHQVNR